MNMVRCMLGEKNVPKNFWPEAVNWSVHILNRCPIFAVKDMTLEEAWSGNKPSVRHFKVFGCIAYVHIPDNLRKKLDDKSIVCVHLGLSEESKAYKLYDPIKRKILVRKDVKFDEVNQLDWENKKIEKTSTVIDQVDVETCSSSKHSESGDECDDHASDTHEDNVIEEVPDSEDDIDEPELAIESNNTWELTELPSGAKKIGVKWIYETKYNEQGKVEKYKARLVAKGYSQQHGIDYNEVFSLVARWDTIRTILAIAAVRNGFVFQLDVKSAFLHGELDEEVYVEQP
ncbi:copia-type polyprotein, partial [Trifolium medium]|nr:copia-type polyprotein [Trifolium medium]